MQDFCIAYREIFSKNELFTTDTTGRLIEEVTNLNVYKYLVGHLGGKQRFGTDTKQNQPNLVIPLREPLAPERADPDSGNIVRLCDIHNAPLATSLATAELLIKALDRNDLGWRRMYK